MLAPLSDYWSGSFLAANAFIALNLLGALLLGMLVGYERSYNGRAAGMRTYGLVCMASAALTVIAGYSVNWYGGHAVPSALGGDPTRIIQGIVTGIGFFTVLWLGGREIAEGTRTTGEFMAFFTAMSLTFQPLRRLGDMAGVWQIAAASSPGSRRIPCCSDRKSGV